MHCVHCSSTFSIVSFITDMLSYSAPRMRFSFRLSPASLDYIVTSITFGIVSVSDHLHFVWWYYFSEDTVNDRTFSSRVRLTYSSLLWFLLCFCPFRYLSDICGLNREHMMTDKELATKYVNILSDSPYPSSAKRIRAYCKWAFYPFAVILYFAYNIRLSSLQLGTFPHHESRDEIRCHIHPVFQQIINIMRFVMG